MWQKGVLHLLRTAELEKWKEKEELLGILTVDSAIRKTQRELLKFDEEKKPPITPCGTTWPGQKKKKNKIIANDSNGTWHNVAEEKKVEETKEYEIADYRHGGMSIFETWAREKQKKQRTKKQLIVAYGTAVAWWRGRAEENRRTKK
ncbi:hypothetical protein AVEN_244857-1 [Araneus ventricosus]|uniref:Uncharacterized protein n=1 Tax=Araneus ventricosus TaxID=182803 RepID=A0A4Y2QB79_ARAVE|nr:hypothetical protein AVEN_244857-1 [Araneus ventricosus]